MKRVACVLVCVAACSTQDNLGNHVFGEARWSISLGSPGIERATAVTVDEAGNVIVAGTCSGVVDFGSGPTECFGAFISQRSSETGDEQWTVRLPDVRVGKLARIDGNIHAIGTRPLLDGLTEGLLVVISASGTVKSSTDLGVAGVVAPVGTIADNGFVFTTGGFGGAPSSDALDALDVYLSSHYPDGTRAWSTKFTGEGRQIGTQLAAGSDGSLTMVVEATGPMTVGEEVVDSPSWPAQLLLRLSPLGGLVWAQAVTHHVQQLATSPEQDVVVGGCPSTGTLDSEGDERWRKSCADPVATVDAVVVSSEGLIVLGGHHDDATGSDGELFLHAFDFDGNLISSARSAAHAEPTDSSIDAIAVEPTGEVVFVTTASHAFDYGNGLLPFAGQYDVVVAKLDSATGRDGQVLLTRTAP